MKLHAALCLSLIAFYCAPAAAVTETDKLVDRIGVQGSTVYFSLKDALSVSCKFDIVSQPQRRFRQSRLCKHPGCTDRGQEAFAPGIRAIRPGRSLHALAGGIAQLTCADRGRAQRSRAFSSGRNR
ncbi:MULTISPECIES: hypothetical protein [unclassified Xanthomonas]|uniref:hypothetical protein n=1 Tax=Xanthomonas sp. LMG 8992 TaxID=1591157 RepID=UPI0018113DAA|nr:hypothetical protein [Xanthomonas sp. LMG 8992]